MKAIVTAEELRASLNYDPETGVFTRIKSSGTQARGAIAGVLDRRGYRLISLGGRKYRAHRLAWLYVHGRWPIALIDHIDRNPSNNRISNLREADASSNQMNSKIHRRNTSGIRGVFWDKARGKWQAKISLHKREVFLGRYKSAEDARAAYDAAAKSHYGEFAVGIGEALTQPEFSVERRAHARQLVLEL